MRRDAAKISRYPCPYCKTRVTNIAKHLRKLSGRYNHLLPGALNPVPPMPLTRAPNFPGCSASALVAATSGSAASTALFPPAQSPATLPAPEPSEGLAAPVSPDAFENVVRFLLKKSFRTTRVVHSELMFLVESMHHPWSVIVAFGKRSTTVRSLPIREMIQEAKAVRVRVVCRLFRFTSERASRTKSADFDYVSGRLTDHDWTVKDPDNDRRDALRSAIAYWGQETIWKTLASLQNAIWCRNDSLYTSRVAADLGYARSGHFIEFHALRGIPRTCCAVVWMDRP